MQRDGLQGGLLSQSLPFVQVPEETLRNRVLQ